MQTTSMAPMACLVPAIDEIVAGIDAIRNVFASMEKFQKSVPTVKSFQKCVPAVPSARDVWSMYMHAGSMALLGPLPCL